jgi:hypothetical protein
MGVDAAGNVYVAGYSINTNDFTQDFVTIKYSPSGTPLWERRYAGAAEGNNSPWPWQ